MDYKKLGFKCGIEIHQQVESHKLFCKCPSIVHDSNPDIFFERKLRAVAGETGKVDIAAKAEVEKDRLYKYQACSSSACLVELDEEPPHEVNHECLLVALEVAKMLNMTVVDRVEFMRKTVVDGSNVSGFQRTALVAVDGYLATSKGKVVVDSLCLEEEAAKKVNEKKHEVTFRLDRLGVALLEIATDASIKDGEHAKEVSSILGMILRSTGKVKRGIGTIRQDVNVSIKGHPRVELKGFQELKYMPKVVEIEVKRQQKTKKGESHVRKVNPGGTSTFMRPMPGAARMYPETDVPPIKITKRMLDLIVLPELIDEKVLRYEKEYSLSSDLARALVKEEKDFVSYVKQFKNIEPNFLAQVVISYPKELKTRLNIKKEVPEKLLREILSAFNEGKVVKEAILDLMANAAEGKKLNFKQFKSLDEKDIEKEIIKIIKKNKGAPFGGIMGDVMKKFRGKVDGKTVSELVKKHS